MRRWREGEQLRIHRRHMWSVPAADTSSLAVSDSAAVIPSDDGFYKDGRKICVGDCALFKPPQDSPPFVGVVRSLILGKEENPRLSVNWLYRPADIKLGKTTLVEAAPNEVFYSFHRDEIPAASLLHPCKVAFLRKGVELPSGISSFVCRRVYDTENKCLWWLTDKDYINERQEEVDQLLDKTRLEMYGAAQSEGRSPKPLNGQSGIPQLRSGSESVHNSTSPLPSQVKSKKRDRGEQTPDPVKRERACRGDDTDCGQLSPEDILRSEITKITNNGRLVDFEGVEKFVQLMQPGTAERKLDLPCRLMLVGVIAGTDSFDCLGWFLQLRGLPVLDEWLQEVHKGKIGHVNNQKESDGSVEEFLLVSLRALDKLPVNLHALQTCHVGKSVNHLRSHKNSEIQKKARSLVDTWKKRVEAEMNVIDAKSGSSRGGSWPSRSVLSEDSHVGNNRRNGGTVGPTQSSACKIPCDKLGSTSSPKSAASVISSGGSGKDLNSATLVGGGSSDVPLAAIKEEKSSSSSHSQNNSQSSSSDRGRSSTAGSVNGSKISGGVSRLQKSNLVTQRSTVSGFQKENSVGKFNSLSRHMASEKVSPTRGTHDRASDVPPVEHVSSHRLIVRLPNTGRSPAPCANGSSFEDPTATVINVSPSAQSEKLDHRDVKVKGKSDDGLQASGASNTNRCEGNASSNVPCSDQRTAEDVEKPTEVSKVTASPLGVTTKQGKSYDASFSPMNALIESCVKFSEASPTTLGGGDDGGMNLLASVAAGEVSRSDVSPSDPEDSCSENDVKSRQFDDSSAQSQHLPDNGANDGAMAGNSVDFSLVKNESENDAMPLSTKLSGDDIVASICSEEKTGECSGQHNSSYGGLQQNAYGSFLKSDGKLGPVKDDSVVLSSKDVKKGDKMEGEGADQLHAHRKSSAVRVRINSPTSKLKARSPYSDEKEKVDKKVVDSGVLKFPEDSTCEKVEKEANEALPSRSCSEVGREDKRGILTEEKPPITANSHQESLVGEKEGTALPSGSVDFVCMEMKDEKAIESKVLSQTERNEKQKTDLSSSNLGQNEECVEEKLEPKDVSDCRPDGPTPHEEPSTKPVQQTEQCVKSIGVRLDEAEAVGTGECSSSANACSSVKLDFDLNESFPDDDDGSQGEVAKSTVPGHLSPVYLCPLPFPISSMSSSFPASVTVASAAKGPFFPPENLLRSKGELGWKGSAATSAFRPAEPRKVLEMPISTSDSPPVDSKKGRPRLDIDLNETCLESGPLDCRGSGLGLDLNSIGECPDGGQISVSNSHKLEIPQLSNRSSFSGLLPKSGLNGSSRDFDLNNGPSFEEGPTETAPRAKNNMQFVSPIHGLRMNIAEQGNFSSWIAPPSNSYSAIAIPSVLSSRGEQSYPIVPATGSPRIVGPPIGGTSFGPEFYRGPVLSSSPAVAFSHAPPFQYAGFPFETNFPVSSNLYSGGSTAYDSSSGRPICFPSIPSQMVGPSGVVSSHYPRPYIMNLPGGTSNLGPENRKWGGQSLDLNTGPGGTELERRDERSSTLRQLPISGSQALADEQMKMYQMAGLKRKEPDGGRDGDRASYNQPSWQ